MDTIFLILFFASFIALIVGLVKPTVFSRFIKGEITRKKTAIIFGITAIVSFVLFGMTTDTDSTKQVTEQNTTPLPVVEQSDTPTEQQQLQQKQISYEIVERWSIPNGGEGKAIVISLDYLNEADMTALGEKLKNDVKNDRSAFIFVFDDKRAASLRGKVLSDELSAADQDFYSKHYVGQYNKNGNTGYNEFAIYFDGVMGTNQKIIKY